VPLSREVGLKVEVQPSMRQAAIGCTYNQYAT
jgi:hypothetical protein